MARITVVGSLNIDLVVQAPALPRPGETVLGGPFAKFPGGKGANQAVAAARLLAGTPGAAVTMIGAVGDDEFANVLRATLADAGVSARLQVAASPTGVGLITIEPRGENTIVVASGANADLTPGFVDAQADAIATADFLLLQLEVDLEVNARAVGLARGHGVRVILNAAPAQPLPDELMARVDVLVANRLEAHALTGVDPAGPPEEMLAALRARGPRVVIVTLGADGAVGMDGDAVVTHPGFPVASIDAVGAGDAFTGALAVALAEQRPLAAALRFACAAGAMATTKRGAMPSLPTRAEVEALAARPR